MELDKQRERLKDLRPVVRRRALAALLAARERGEVAWPQAGSAVNLHCHTIFSYNGYGHSPASLAWLAGEHGWHAVGMVDFDVLDATDECHTSCDLVGVRGAAGLETRTYMPEFSTLKINSPGEPGVCYFIGMGFARTRPPAAAAAVLADMRQRAADRNRLLVGRVNAYLAPVVIDYDRDVLPLTPSGNATERHILVAYDAAARRVWPERAALVDFWAAKLAMDAAAVERFLGDKPFPHDAIRSKLMKKGGPGYIQPDAGTFPALDDVSRAIVACGALPICGWLDGLSQAEQQMDRLLEHLIARGAVGVNVVPDRNWNLKDPAERALKVGKLNDIMALAAHYDLPVLAGTEMNKAGQKLVDDFDADALRPYRNVFVQGADWVYGHTLLQRALRRGYQSTWARRALPARRERNAFYMAVGATVPPGPDTVARVAALAAANQPDALLAQLTAAFSA
jgi:hypothetical protein